MNKGKVLFFIFLAVLILALVGGGIYYKFQKSGKTALPNNISPTQAPVEELATWTDPAEFTFQYPKSLKLDPHDEDEENYAHVELTATDTPGGLIVWVKDTIAYDIESWLKQAKVIGAIDSTLAGEPAKKILTGKESQKWTITTIHDGYLYQIEVDTKGNNAYWNKVYETVSSFFRFTPSEAFLNEEKNTEETTSQSSTEEEASFAEEVIE